MKHNFNKAIPPYEKKTVDKKSVFATNFKHVNKRSGVYLIYNDKKLVYIGHSRVDLYKTMYRHFQQWNDKDKQKRVTYSKHLATKQNPKYTVRVILCTAYKAPKLERALILKHNPKDNPLKYKGYQLSPTDVKVYDSIMSYEVPLIFREYKNKTDEKTKKDIIQYNTDDQLKKAGLIKKKSVTKTKLNRTMATHIEKRKVRAVIPDYKPISKKQPKIKKRSVLKETASTYHYREPDIAPEWERSGMEHITEYHIPFRPKKRR